MSRGLRLWGLALLSLACALAALLAGPAAAAQAKDWRIDNLDVLLNVQRNGDVLVDETITFNFQGNYHFVARNVPTKNYAGMDQIEVRDAKGAVLPRGDAPGTFDAFKEGDVQYVQINFDLTDTAATYTIHYRAKKVVQFFDQGDELRWYVFDAETPVPITNVKATVNLPGSVESASMVPNVSAGYGVKTSALSPAASTMVYQAANCPPYTNFWIVTGFPKGIVKYTWTAARVAAFVVPKIGFLLPIAFFLGMLLIWRKRGRDEPATIYSTYVSEPPSSLSPGLAGALIDEKVDSKEVMATIIDLARRGYIEITDTDKQGMLHKTTTIFTRRKAFDDLKGFELHIAQSLFDDNHPDQVTTDELKNHFYTHIQPLVEMVYVEVASAGLFFKNPRRARARWFAYGFAAAVVLGVLTTIFALADVGGWGYFLIGSIIAVVIVWVFAPHMPQRTPRGAQEQRKWEAFRNYLKDLTRFKDMETANESFNKYLPYAIAFGVEKEWVRRFEDTTVASPEWYHPPIILPIPMGGGLDPGGFGGGSGGTLTQAGAPSAPGGGFSLDTISDGLFRSLGNMSSALTSVPSSSGSHGAFGGGGFSGGGFGGGFSGGGGGGGFHAG